MRAKRSRASFVEVRARVSAPSRGPFKASRSQRVDGGADNRLKALDRLVETWRSILRPKNLKLFEPHLAEVEAILKWVKVKKGLRNRVAHWAWIRSNDETIFGFRFTTQPMKKAGPPNMTMTVKELSAFAEEINEWAYRATAVTLELKRLPSFPRGALQPARQPENPPTDSE